MNLNAFSHKQLQAARTILLSANDEGMSLADVLQAIEGEMIGGPTVAQKAKVKSPHTCVHCGAKLKRCCKDKKMHCPECGYIPGENE